MRMGWEYEGQRPETAFYCGYIGALIDQYLNSKDVALDYEAFDGDVFYLGENCEIPLEKAMYEQVKGYSGTGTYDSNGTFVEYERNDRFHVSLSKVPEQVDPVQAIYSITRIFRENGKEHLRPCSAETMIERFVRGVSFQLGEAIEIYTANADITRQLANSMHYQYIVYSAIFIQYGSYMLMLTSGCNE